MLGKLWRGEYRLATTFWGFYVGGCLLCLFGAGVLIYLSRFVHARPIGFTLGLVCAWAYWLIASSGVWQSARDGIASPIWINRMWAILARGVILLVAAQILWNLMNDGAVTLMGIITGRLELDW